MNKQIITRFAPSPTGFLHIGGARTALFNYLYAKNKGGKFLLRIEDTDKKRSTQQAIDAIIKGLHWLGLEPDGEIVYQSANSKRHLAVAQYLVDTGKAYYCYSSATELQKLRADGDYFQGNIAGYSRKWRNSEEKPPQGVQASIRLKIPLKQVRLVIDDLVQGKVSYNTDELEDFVIVRSDGTPTYMLAVVVDDHDMGITDVIRGNDHLINSFRQLAIYQAMRWSVPNFAHIPLIHGEDGGKLSKRHGALGIEEYSLMGFLPDAINSYLLKLGCSYGTDDDLDVKQAINLFDVANIKKSPAQLDRNKMYSVNASFIKATANERLLELLKPIFFCKYNLVLDSKQSNLILQAIPGIKNKVKSLDEIVEQSHFYLLQASEITIENELLTYVSNQELMLAIRDLLLSLDNWSADSLEHSLKEFAKQQRDVKIKEVMCYLRIAICYSNKSPSLFHDVLPVLGKKEIVDRIEHFIKLYY